MIRPGSSEKQVIHIGWMIACLLYTATTLGFILCCWVTLKMFTAPFTEMLPWYDPSGTSFQTFFFYLFPAMVLVSLVNRIWGSFGIASPSQQNLPFFTAMALSLMAGGGAAESHSLQAVGAVICMTAGFSTLILCVDDLLEFWDRKVHRETDGFLRLPTGWEEFQAENDGRGGTDGRR